MEKTYKDDSFVAISDFHSFQWPLDKINDYYLNEYEHIFILGDATDRGPDYDGKDGVELLLKIKELTEQYPNRVHYIPGNHDSFLYNFMRTYDDEQLSLDDILYNGGLNTIKDIKYLHDYNKEHFNSLMNWLGSLPLQTKQTYNGKTYCFAHALFDQRVYDYDKNISLKDEFETNNDSLKYAIYNMLWFRKNEGQYDYEALPPYEEVMVVGHTPTSSRPKNIDLPRKDGTMCHVVCVDNGIIETFDTMGKFDGNTYNFVQTHLYEHGDTSKTPIDKIIEIFKKVTNKDINSYDDAINNIDNLNNDELSNVIENLKNTFDERVANAIEHIQNISKKISLKKIVLAILAVVVIITVGSEVKKNVSADNSIDATTTTMDEDYIIYVVKQGDYLNAIAAKYNTTVDDILALNPEITNPDNIIAGTTIKIPNEEKLILG